MLYLPSTSTFRGRALGLSLVLALIATLGMSVSSQAVPVSQPIDTFEGTVSQWTTLAEADASMTVAQVSGERSGSSAASFTLSAPTGAGWAGATRGFDPVAASSLAFRVKATDVFTFAVRINDETNQTFQYIVEIAQDVSGWQTVRIPDLSAGEHWGGANDGVFHGGVGNIMIILNPWHFTKA